MGHPPLMRLSNTILSVLLLLLVSGCSLLPEQIDETKDWSANKLYSSAKEALNNGDYEKAVKYFEFLEARYPFGRYAQQAQLEIGYAYYKYDEPDSAIAAMDRFIKMHPRHPNVDYAYYLKGLVNFDRGRNLVDRFVPRDPSERDPGASRDAFRDFSELVQRFPDSKYAGDAGKRMIFLRNNLAKGEVLIAGYYMRRGAYIAAANRAKLVIEKYQGTPAVPEALDILAGAYDRLGLQDLSADVRRVKQQNYPDGTLEAPAEDGSWWWPFDES